MEPRFKQFQLVPTYQLQIPENETESSVSNLCTVLDALSNLFSQYVPGLKEKPLTIRYFPSDNTPMCAREWQLILLNCDISYWNQSAFQFAHELCHYAIPADVHPKLRWVEETICQAASTFFLFQLEDVFGKFPYARYFSGYAERAARAKEEFDWKDPAELATLEGNPYLREKNTYVANHLLPVFWEVPKVWAAIPLLGSVHEAPSTQAGLDEWLRLTPPDLRPGLLRIKDVLV